MTFVNTIVALIITGTFLFGFSQAFFPVYNAWANATAQYNVAHSIHFVAESFRAETARANRNIENWKNLVSSVNGLESIEIFELKEHGVLRALKAVYFIAGERIVVIGALYP